MTNSNDDTTEFTMAKSFQIRDGDVVVVSGSTVEISDIQNGDLLIEPGGSAKITGILNGTVTNRQGFLHLVGIINGNLISAGGENQIDTDATIKGETIEQSVNQPRPGTNSAAIRSSNASRADAISS